MFDTGRPSWQNPRVIAILLVVFLAGAVVGALTMREGLHRWIHPSKTDTLLKYDRLTKELKLTPEQSRQLRAILDDYARYRQDLQVQLDDWQATGKNQILRILDPDQRVRFEKLVNEK